MAELCACDSGLLNTGLPSCVDEIKDFRGIYYFNRIANDGTVNGILSTDTLDDAFITAKINHTDVSKRWFPLIGFEEVGGERVDPVYQTSKTGTQKFVKEGVRNQTAQLWSWDFALDKAINATRCVEIAFIIVDASGKAIGIVDGADLRGIRVQKSTLHSKPVFSDGSNASHLAIQWQWQVDEMDYNLGYIVPESDCDLLSYNGLIDITSAVSGISQTGFTLTLSTKFGALGAKGKLTGLVASDFFSAVGGTASRLYNVTDASAVTISTVTETSAGVYTFTFASQTVADVIRVTPVKTGYSFDAVIANTVTIA